ncbi:hypothetical protein NKH18_50515 [Streptomyces sp. M10(2022)]
MTGAAGEAVRLAWSGRSPTPSTARRKPPGPSARRSTSTPTLCTRRPPSTPRSSTP